MPRLTSNWIWLTTSALALSLASLPAFAQDSTPSGTTETAAGTNRPLNLAKNSPFRDPDIIYLEADELINDQENNTLTAQGEVEGRYQDRTLRAEKVVYNLDTGEVFASGNVVIVDATGATQYATKIELSSELETGTASDFTARFPEGGLTGAKLATRTSAQEIELYNAYYTACEPCEKDGKTQKPTWRIKARKVKQDRKKRSVEYRDAVFEFKGIPIFYTPYLAHPDPSVDRSSGWLNPFGGLSSSKGVNFRMPYYWAIDDYSELTLTPRIYQKVNPLLELDYRRKFYSGELNIEGSLTYGSVFDRDGDPFTDASLFNNPDEAPIGKRLRSHIFASGLFDFNEDWIYGFGVQAASDDTYLNRYDLGESSPRFGLYEADSRRLVSQAFVVGQDDNYRVSASTYGFQSLITNISQNDDGTFNISREDDSTLPITAPKIEAEAYFSDPVIGGRLRTFGDATVLTRNIGDDYTRVTGGVDWSKTVIAPGGIEIKPFAEARADYFKIDADSLNDNVDFSRAIGQVGIDFRYPFIKSTDSVDLIIEPRAQITQKFGDGKVELFDSDNNGSLDLLQDSLEIDLDQSLLWASNKATGFDFWQEGFRADVGASFIADWDKTRAHLFLGKSFASGVDDEFALSSGLQGDDSDIVGLFELDLNGKIISTTRVRYDDDDSAFRRLDTSLRLNTKRIRAFGRYYRLESAALTNLDIPSEEISGGFTVQLLKDWSARYRAFHDIDQSLTRRQDLSLIFDDACTRIEFIYTRNNFDSDIVRDNEGFGVKVSLLTLGDFN